MIKAKVDGKHVGVKRFEIVKRALTVLMTDNPNIDWESSNLVITVEPKTNQELQNALAPIGG